MAGVEHKHKHKLKLIATRASLNSEIRVKRLCVIDLRKVDDVWQTGPEPGIGARRSCPAFETVLSSVVSLVARRTSEGEAFLGLRDLSPPSVAEAC